MAYFSYRYRKPSTGKINKGRRSAYDVDELRSMLAADGIEEIQDIVREPDMPATHAQLGYLRDLGVRWDGNLDIREASDLIDLTKSGRSIAGGYERGLAHFFKTEATRFASKATIYDRIAQTLVEKGDAFGLAKWYVFRVYRDGFDRKFGPGLENPDDPSLVSIARALVDDDRLIRSVLREAPEARGWRWFGRYVAPDGAEHHGASRKTAAYEFVRSRLFMKGMPAPAKKGSSFDIAPRSMAQPGNMVVASASPTKSPLATQSQPAPEVERPAKPIPAAVIVVASTVGVALLLLLAVAMG